MASMNVLLIVQDKEGRPRGSLGCSPNVDLDTFDENEQLCSQMPLLYVSSGFMSCRGFMVLSCELKHALSMVCNPLHAPGLILQRRL
jgi:hypothetical protein